MTDESRSTSAPTDAREAGDPPARLTRAAASLKALAAKLSDESGGSEDLDRIIAEIVAARKAQFGSRPRSRKGQGARAKLLAYFQENVGRPIDGEELQAVSGIGEWARRVRELRVEHGYDIEQVGRSAYVMHSSEPDADLAARWQLANSIRRQPGGSRSRIEAFFEANVGQVVTREQLDYVAKIKEGSRRVRELRDEEGWPINSHIDEPQLASGEYRLVSRNPEDRRDPLQRDYTEDLREQVFSRDNYSCQSCGRDRVKAEQAGDSRFYLELHHKVAVADELAALPKSERNDAANLLTLCHRCHNLQTEKLKRAKSAQRKGDR